MNKTIYSRKGVIALRKREHGQSHISLGALQPGEDKDSLTRYLEDVTASPVAMTFLSSEEEADLARRIKAGDKKARANLVEANLRFVISIAREYQNQGVPLGDLIGAGNMSLITAAERFDGTKGFKFISYAVWWIRQAVIQTLAEYSRVVRLPLNQTDTLRRISRCASDLAQANSERPSAAEVATALGISVNQVHNALSAGQRIMSLDATFDGNDENSLMEMLADSRQESPDAQLLRAALKEEIEAVLATLSKKEEEVVRLYFGLDGGKEMTLEEIGAKLNFTRERIRQIKEKALEKMRHPSRGGRLKIYIATDGETEPPANVYSAMVNTKLATNPPRR